MRRSLTLAGVGALALLGICLTTCSVSTGLGGGGVQIEFTLLGKTITLSLRDIGTISFRANESTVVPVGFSVSEAPSETIPASGRMILPSNSVSVGRRLDAKTIARSQSLPLYGSAILRFLVAPGQSADLCDSATLMGEYQMTLTAGMSGIIEEVYPLGPSALAAVAANDVTICVEVDADFDGELTIDDMHLEFDHEDGTPPADSIMGGPGSTPPPGSMMQVPIANASGTAVRAGVNRTVGGVDYAVVGVLEAKTPDVTVATASPDSITIVPASLGLASVTRLYMAVHSAFVPDVADGANIATLTATYTGGGEPTVLDFVLGQNTSEWSYDRPEHVAVFGGVRHARAPFLYSYSSSVDSASSYTAYSYTVTLDLDSTRALNGLTLDMTPPASYASARADNAPEPTWAMQATTAITLTGPALPPPPPPDDSAPDEACCLADGGCEEMSPGSCQSGGGTALGPETTCAADAGQCDDVVPPDDEPPEPTGACCLPDDTCVAETSTDCLLDGGDYQGDGTPCLSVTCGTPPDVDEPEYVIWYTGNVCCWGAPLMYITDRDTFNQPRLRSSFPGGGISPTEMALKVELQGGFDSVEAARDWICPQFTSSSYHYWCTRHYQFDGKNWQPGGLGCDLSSLPETSTPPEADVCAEHAGEVSDNIACCYPNTLCVEQTLADCEAGGGTPHPDGETSCGVSPCPDPCPEDGLCDEDCGDSIVARDPDCDRCDSDGTCIAQCPAGDPDCCIGGNMVQNGDAEAGAGAMDFSTTVSSIPDWNVIQGNLTAVSYDASANDALDAADSSAVGGGSNYFAGGPGGISPAIAQNLIFLNEFLPLSVIETGEVSATLSAYIGGWATHADDVVVTATFRDELINDVAEISIGPVTNVDRDNDTQLQFRCATVAVPATAVTAEVRIIARRSTGVYNDGYVDNISLVLEHDSCPDNAASGGCE